MYITFVYVLRLQLRIDPKQRTLVKAVASVGYESIGFNILLYEALVGTLPNLQFSVVIQLQGHTVRAGLMG